MKRIYVVLIMLLVASPLSARVSPRSLVELGPKATVYINDDVRFGIAVDAVVNPLRNIGFRLDLAEIVFDPTSFHFNRDGSLDAFVYIPLRRMWFYVYTGVGLRIHDTGEDTQTQFAVRGGVGLNYAIRPRASLFVEPGISISGNGETDVSFRISAGARFGIIK